LRADLGDRYDVKDVLYLFLYCSIPFISFIIIITIIFRHCWECLGEAYMSRGSYMAAMKAFAKAAEV